mmetsp:Transcript_29077/g.40153  ORF Transcript_29077/g.40153 Transcript_29077/m.40153 type:complete len:221 (-) Transcript_29077:265-927(-)
MPLFHLVNCAALTFGPHFIYYYATPLADFEVWPVSLKGAAAYCATFFAKLVCMAAFVSTYETSAFNPLQEGVQGVIGLLDVVGLYFALRHSSGPALSDKLQAVGLGWGLGNAVLTRLAALSGARSMEFSWTFLMQGGHANANLVHSVSFAAVVSMGFVRKNKSSAMAPLLYCSMFLHALFPTLLSCIQQLFGLTPASSLVVDCMLSLATAFSSWQLYMAC